MQQLLEEHAKGTLSLPLADKRPEEAAPTWDDMPKELFDEEEDEDFGSSEESSGLDEDEDLMKMKT